MRSRITFTKVALRKPFQLVLIRPEFLMSRIIASWTPSSSR